MKSILVEVTGDDTQDAALQAGLDLVRAAGGHLTCVQVRPYPFYGTGDGFGGPDLLVAIIAEVDAQCAEQRARIEPVLQGEGVSWDWLRRDGEPVEVLAGLSRLADAVVVAQRPGGARAKAQAAFIGGLTLTARTPVIVVPPAIRGFAVAGSAMIAWNGSFESARALRAVLPMLAMAETVDVLTIGDEDPDFPASAACRYLARHGIGAEIHVGARDGGSTGAAIMRAAAERGTAYVVAGAYGHSRVREYVFGGVTRALIEESSLPLVLAH